MRREETLDLLASAVSDSRRDGSPLCGAANNVELELGVRVKVWEVRSPDKTRGVDAIHSSKSRAELPGLERRPVLLLDDEGAGELLEPLSAAERGMKVCARGCVGPAPVAALVEEPKCKRSECTGSEGVRGDRGRSDAPCAGGLGLR